MKRHAALLLAFLLIFNAFAISAAAAPAVVLTADAAAEEAPAPASFLEGSMGTIIILVLFIPLMYFLFIRPESKKKKQQKQMLEALKVGETITTIGGLMGKIVDLSDEGVTIETSEDRVRIEITKWAISTVGRAAEQTR